MQFVPNRSGRHQMEYSTPAITTTLRMIEAMPAVSRVKICFGSNAVLGIFGASRPSALIRAPTTSVHPPGSLILIGLVAVMVAVALLT